MPLPPSVYQRLTSSPPLMNLAQVLAYHRAYVYSQLVLMGVLFTSAYKFRNPFCEILDPQVLRGDAAPGNASNARATNYSESVRYSSHNSSPLILFLFIFAAYCLYLGCLNK